VLVDEDVAFVVAIAPKLNTEIVGRILAEGEEDLVGVELHSVGEHEAVNSIALAADARDRLREHGNVQRVELPAVLRLVEIRRPAVGANDDVVRPGGEIERHSHSAPAVPDDDDLFAPRLVAVAVGTDVRVGSVDMVESRNIRPHVADTDRQQQSSYDPPTAALEADHELVVGGLLDAEHDRVDEIDAERAADLSSTRAKLWRANPFETEDSIDPACLPVSRIAAVDQKDRVQITRRPDRRRQSRRSAADDPNIETRRAIRVGHAAGSGKNDALRLADRSWQQVIQESQRRTVGEGDVVRHLDGEHLRRRIP